MQTTSSGWANKVTQGSRRIGFGFLAGFNRTTNSGVRFWTINQSRIGGPDIIKGGGGVTTFFDKYALSDYSQYVKSISVYRKLGQYPYGVIMAEADIELDNTSKKFLPQFDTTIGSGVGLPNRPIKISVGIEDEYMKLFVGFTTMPSNSLNNRLTNLHAFDAFNYINGFVSTASGAQVSKYAHEIKAALLEEAGFTSSQYLFDKSLQPPIGFLATNGKKAGEIFQKLDEAEQAMSFVDENGLIRSWNRQHSLTQSGVVSFQLTYSNIKDIQWQNTPIINDVIVRSKPRAVQARQKIWESTTTIALEPGQDTDVFIDFTDDDGDLPVTTVDIPKYITTASGSQSYYASNINEDGSGLAFNANITVISAYSFGNTYRVTFRNSHIGRLYLTQLVIYATPAKVTYPIEERYQDATSIEAFGRNPMNNGEPLVIENDLIQDASQARTLAYTLVKEYKSPGKRYICPVAIGSDPARQIGDSGQIYIQDTRELKNVYITGITNVIDRNGIYSQVLEVEERTPKRYWTINQSKIGGPDGIAP